jgi:hypothetical protein
MQMVSVHEMFFDLNHLIVLEAQENLKGMRISD